MNDSIPQSVLRRLNAEVQHSIQAPASFLEAWKRGVQLAGTHWFGDGTPAQMDRATTKDDLVPRLTAIKSSIGVLSGGEQTFLAAMVSFYDTREGGTLLRRTGFQGLADLTNLDLRHRQVIADLILHYAGW